jgi:hypothetical protein
MPRINLSYPINMAIKLRNAQRGITTPSKMRAQIVEALFLKRIIIALDKVGRLYVIFRNSFRLESAIQSEDLASDSVKRATFLDGRSGFDVPSDFFLTNKLKLDGTITSIGRVPTIEGIIVLTSTSAYLVTFAFHASNVVEVDRCELLLTSASNPIVKIISLPNESRPALSELLLLDKSGQLFRIRNINNDTIVDARTPKLEKICNGPVAAAISLDNCIFVLPVGGKFLTRIHRYWDASIHGGEYPQHHYLTQYFLGSSIPEERAIASSLALLSFDESYIKEAIPARVWGCDTTAQFITINEYEHDYFREDESPYVLLLVNKKMCLGHSSADLIRWSPLILPFEKNISFITASRRIAAFITDNGECWICPDFESKQVIEIAYPEGLRGNIAKVVLDSNKGCSALIITKFGDLHFIETIL